MRYIFVSDIHGEFNKLMDALKEKNFDPENDTLITLGDLFDRGSQSLEVLDYVLSLPHCIKVWGNHDRRLRELFLGDAPNDCDQHNGVPATLQSFTKGVLTQRNRNSKSDMRFMIMMIKTDERLAEVKKKIWNYFDQCVWAVEFPHLIGTHAWIPCIYRQEGKFTLYEYYPAWRFWANEDCWDAATWSNTSSAIIGDANPPDKMMIVGHWHAWRIRESFLKEKIWELKNGDWEIIAPEKIGELVEYNDVIYIDGCTALPEGKVIAYVYLSEVEPLLYDKSIVR